MPGLLSSVSFGQSDLWAAGTLIYELYGLDNPFSPVAASNGRKSKQLDSATYKESQMPRLPPSTPPWIRHLATDILRRNPRAVSILCSCIFFLSLSHHTSLNSILIMHHTSQHIICFHHIHTSPYNIYLNHTLVFSTHGNAVLGCL